MNTIDITISVILLIGIIRGFIKGFIYEIAVLGTFVICYFLGFRLAEFVATYLSKWLSVNPVSMRYVSLILACIGISIGMFFHARLFEGLVKIVALGIFNKIAGAVFGGLKYAFLLSLFLFFFNKYNFSNKHLNADKKAESALYYPVLKLATLVIGTKAN
jgi:membrane protein required for colicin V production